PLFSLWVPALGAHPEHKEIEMTVALLALLLAAPAHACSPAPTPVRAARFAPGEQLRYRLDVLGADVGTFEVSVEAPQSADRGRDMLSTFLYLRALPLKAGTPVCLEVYAARKMWTMAGAVGPREPIESPLGKFGTVRVDLTATRLDDAAVKRSAHVWITDDDRRLPVVAVGEVKG